LYGLGGALFGGAVGIALIVAGAPNSSGAVAFILAGGIGAALGGVIGVGLALAQLLEDVKAILRQHDDDPRVHRARHLLDRLDEDAPPLQPWSAGDADRP
jgi:hypothetical protein